MCLTIWNLEAVAMWWRLAAVVVLYQCGFSSAFGSPHSGDDGLACVERAQRVVRRGGGGLNGDFKWPRKWGVNGEF